MAERKFGKTYKMSEKFEDYSYIINGVGGIGKTTLVYEIGKIITGSNEGTFIITCGGENQPKHIPDAFGDVAHDFKTFVAIIKELCTNKEAYPYTKFVAIDSLDECMRTVEDYVVSEWNSMCTDVNERAKSIKQAYKGFQGGENRATGLIIQQIKKLQDAGYSILEIGHTKTKTKEDVVSKIQFEQLTCNLDNKYYNALKDKVNLVAMCYFEHVIDNVEEKKNAFTKKMDKVGELKDRKRVMVFADDDNAIDCKSHFEYITHKIDFSAANFIKAVEDAIKIKLAGGDKSVVGEEESEVNVEELPNGDVTETPATEMIEEADDVMVEEELELIFDPDEAKTKIRNLHKKGTPEQKKRVKEIMNGEQLADIEDEEILKEIIAVFE